MKLAKLFKEIILPAGLLSSMIVGAGMFALPYVFFRAGILVGLVHLGIFTFVAVTIHRMYATIISCTEGKHRFVGYARIYLGSLGFWIGIFATGLGIFLVLTAYIILAENFLNIIFSGFSGIGLYIFWAIGSSAIVLSLRRLAKMEFVIVALMGLIVVLLFLIGAITGEHISDPSYSSSTLFLPYGIVLFSLMGRAGISAISEYYLRNKLSTKKFYTAITAGTIAPAIVYTLFIFAVLWLSPNEVTPDALSGLHGLFRPLLILVGALGLLALLTSYFFMGLEIRDIMRYDLKFPLVLSLFVVVFAPILFFLIGLSDLIDILGLVGGFFIAIESVMVVMMFSKLKKWNLLGALLSIVFIVGALYELYNFLFIE